MSKWVAGALVSFIALSAVAAGCSSSSGSTSSGSSTGGTDDGGSTSSSSSSSTGGTSTSSTSSSSTSSSTGGTDSGSDVATTGDGGKLPFGSPCTSNDQCEGGACISFPAKGGMLCTEACPTDPTKCPNNGAGCNGMGYCKVP